MSASAPVSIRPAVAGDAAALHALSIEAITTSAAEHYDAAQLAAWSGRRTVESHRRMIATASVLVAELDGEPAGFAALIVGEGELDQLFVSPAAGGRGVASALLRAADELALAAGLRRLDARASHRALATFRRAGYVVVAEETVAVDGQRLARSHVRKSLAE